MRRSSSSSGQIARAYAVPRTESRRRGTAVVAAATLAALGAAHVAISLSRGSGSPGAGGHPFDALPEAGGGADALVARGGADALVRYLNSDEIPPAATDGSREIERARSLVDSAAAATARAASAATGWFGLGKPRKPRPVVNDAYVVRIKRTRLEEGDPLNWSMLWHAVTIDHSRADLVRVDAPRAPRLRSPLLACPRLRSPMLA